MTHQELLLQLIAEARDFHGTGDEPHQYESIERYCAEWILDYAAEIGWQIPEFDMQSYIAYRKDEEYPDFFEWFDEYVMVLERLEFEDGYAKQVPEAFVRTEAFKNHIFYELTAEEIRTMDDETLLKLY